MRCELLTLKFNDKERLPGSREMSSIVHLKRRRGVCIITASIGIDMPKGNNRNAAVPSTDDLFAVLMSDIQPQHKSRRVFRLSIETG
jgi:hypothetical protein